MDITPNDQPLSETQVLGTVQAVEAVQGWKLREVNSGLRIRWLTFSGGKKDCDDFPRGKTEKGEGVEW